MIQFLLNAITALSIFITGEYIVNRFVFKKLKEKYSRLPKAEPEIRILGFSESIFRGIIERLVLYTALYYQFAPILVVFGALKLGTRIKEEKEHVSNSYFLIGNFTSILIAIVYVVLYLRLQNDLYGLLC